MKRYGKAAECAAIEEARRRGVCPDCDQPMLPGGQVKRPNEYDHARGCPSATQAPGVDTTRKDTGK